MHGQVVIKSRIKQNAFSRRFAFIRAGTLCEAFGLPIGLRLRTAFRSAAESKAEQEAKRLGVTNSEFRFS